jgi:gliding motility-associated-like protein
MFHHGDSTGATYYWYGPAGFTSTMQNPFIYPAKYPNTGRYYVVKTKLGVRDTDSTYVVVHHKPVMTIMTNSPLCTTNMDTLYMRVTPDSAIRVKWVGPLGFTSTIVNPYIDSFQARTGAAGIYTVYGETAYGCKDTESTNVALTPPPGPPVITGVPAYCYGATFIPPTVVGTGILWYPVGSSTVTGTPIAPWNQTPKWIRTDSAGNYTLYATQTYGCKGPLDSFKIKVYPRINPNFTFDITLGCDSDVVYLTNTSTNANSYSWRFDGSGSDTARGFTIPVRHAFAAPHMIHSVTLTGTNPVCSNDTTLYPDMRHDVTANFTPTPPVLCLGQTTVMTDGSTSNAQGAPKPLASHLWTFGDGSMDTTNGTPPAHLYNAPGIYPVHLKVTDAISCVDTITKNVTVLQVTILGLRDTALCLRNPFQIKDSIVMYPNIGLTAYNYKWTPTDHLMPGDSAVQKPYFDGLGKVTFTFTATDSTYGCADTGTVTINSVLGAKLLNLTAAQTITYGSSIQLNADNEVIYWWTPDNGSLDNANINNPVATPARTTLYTVYGYDINGCLDSAFINITVDSTMNEGIPSAFSPNGDGQNDVFRPVGTRFQHLVEFRVYNRWGQQMFYSNDNKKGWDGTFNGTPQDMGVYYYTIIVARPGGEGENIHYKGEITLIR